MIPPPFPMLDLRFVARFERPWQLPPYAGSLLRGAFGASLRHLSCMTGFRSCEGCPLANTCPYPALFDPVPADLAPVGLPRGQKGLPPPYILRLPEADPGPDGHMQFGMCMIGHGTDRLAYVIEAWRRALHRGLGRDRVRGELLVVHRAEDGAPVWAGDTITLPPPLLSTTPPPADEVMLLSRTPWRLLATGAPVAAERLTPRFLTGAIVRRARLLALHGDAGAQAEVANWPVGEWLAAADDICHTPHLIWRDWHRWSARQRQRMNLGGYVGQWVWRGVPEMLWPLLTLGASIHVGKEASFGLGAYEVRAA